MELTDEQVSELKRLATSKHKTKKEKRPAEQFSPDKMANLILLICQKCKDDPTFDDEKLKWLLFHCDMKSFVETGKSITGDTYTKE